jgi:hypothetical protein
MGNQMAWGNKRKVDVITRGNGTLRSVLGWAARKVLGMKILGVAEG